MTPSPPLQLRPALDSDRPGIHDVLMGAFGEVDGQEIAQLVTDLLEDPSAAPLWSLVAVVDHAIAGHILFTGARVESSARTVSASILAPLAVHPAFQDQGIGGRLIAEGIRLLRAAAVDLVFVLGHPGYYARHGFAPAGARGFEAPYPIAPENADAWMVQALQPGAAQASPGRVVCAAALDDPSYWRE